MMALALGLTVPRYSAGRGTTRLELVTPAGRKATVTEPGAGYGNPLRLAPTGTTRLAHSPCAEPPAPCAGVRGAGTTQGDQ
jgi:hypothetical protein